MKYGNVPKVEFKDSVSFEVTHNLIIIPVEIKGQTYRFLFDTGAPFSISKHIQDQLNFKTISSGKIVDADNSHTQVDYVSVDTLTLGHTSFAQQTAFVADFDANPILECMDLDGIIGSNLMHHCNWTIDMQDNKLTFTDAPSDTSGIHIPFETNLQYDILVHLELNSLRIIPVKVDYGSNGALALEERTFNLLLERHDIDTFLINRGHSQSGLIGEIVESNEKISPIDSIWLGDVLYENIVATSSNMSLLGTKLLSSYIVSIDWDRQRLYFKPNMKGPILFETCGISIAYSDEKSLYIQSIIEGSKADIIGIETNMQVLKLNDLDFTKDNFCDYMNLINSKPDSLLLELDVEGVATPFTLIKEEIFKYN